MITGKATSLHEYFNLKKNLNELNNYQISFKVENSSTCTYKKRTKPN